MNRRQPDRHEELFSLKTSHLLELSSGRRIPEGTRFRILFGSGATPPVEGYQNFDLEPYLRGDLYRAAEGEAVLPELLQSCVIVEVWTARQSGASQWETAQGDLAAFALMQFLATCPGAPA